MKKCPYCAEEIQGDAIKCKYCGEWLSNNQDTSRYGKSQKNATLSVDMEKSWKKFSYTFNFLIVLTITTFLLAFIANNAVFSLFMIVQLILVIIVIILAGRFAYLVTEKKMFALIGLWLFFPIPLLNFVLLYYYTNELRTQYFLTEKKPLKKTGISLHIFVMLVILLLLSSIFFFLVVPLFHN